MLYIYFKLNCITLLNKNLPARQVKSSESSVRLYTEQLDGGSGLVAGSIVYTHGNICCPARFVARHDNFP